MARGGPSRTAHLWFPFQRARRALADAAGAANPLGGRRATAGSRLSLLPPPAAAPQRTKSAAMVQVCAAVIAAQSTLLDALKHAEEWRVGGGGRAPRARAREAPCRVARCAANMAADGRKVLGRDGAASHGDQGGA